jgi:hypothetical protein
MPLRNSGQVTRHGSPAPAAASTAESAGPRTPLIPGFSSSRVDTGVQCPEGQRDDISSAGASRPSSPAQTSTATPAHLQLPSDGPKPTGKKSGASPKAGGKKSAGLSPSKSHGDFRTASTPHRRDVATAGVQTVTDTDEVGVSAIYPPEEEEGWLDDDPEQSVARRLNVHTAVDAAALDDAAHRIAVASRQIVLELRSRLDILLPRGVLAGIGTPAVREDNKGILHAADSVMRSATWVEAALDGLVLGKEAIEMESEACGTDPREVLDRTTSVSSRAMTTQNSVRPATKQSTLRCTATAGSVASPPQSAGQGVALIVCSRCHGLVTEGDAFEALDFASQAHEAFDSTPSAADLLVRTSSSHHQLAPRTADGMAHALSLQSTGPQQSMGPQAPATPSTASGIATLARRLMAAATTLASHEGPSAPSAPAAVDVAMAATAVASLEKGVRSLEACVEAAAVAMPVSAPATPAMLARLPTPASPSALANRSASTPLAAKSRKQSGMTQVPLSSSADSLPPVLHAATESSLSSIPVLVQFAQSVLDKLGIAVSALPQSLAAFFAGEPPATHGALQNALVELTDLISRSRTLPDATAALLPSIPPWQTAEDKVLAPDAIDRAVTVPRERDVATQRGDALQRQVQHLENVVAAAERTATELAETTNGSSATWLRSKSVRRMRMRPDAPRTLCSV